MFPYLQQDSTNSGQQYGPPSAFLPPQQITLPPIRPLRFWHGLKWWPIPEWFYSSTGYDTGAVTVLECWQGILIPTTRLYQLWATMIRISSTSTDHSPPLSEPADFGLSINACQFLSGSIAAPVMTQVLRWTESVGRVIIYP